MRSDMSLAMAVLDEPAQPAQARRDPARLALVRPALARPALARAGRPRRGPRVPGRSGSPGGAGWWPGERWWSWRCWRRSPSRCCWAAARWPPATAGPGRLPGPAARHRRARPDAVDAGRLRRPVRRPAFRDPRDHVRQFPDHQHHLPRRAALGPPLSLRDRRPSPAQPGPARSALPRPHRADTPARIPGSRPSGRPGQHVRPPGASRPAGRLTTTTCVRRPAGPQYLVVTSL